ncbi:STAS domain-containing protein [Mangrovibrevibacter kandeliae]|uniref:STAS domain-containing protein n=1 Tax=Mangrovibrevibacter kandeliae TaxID=2968473 RepID=UPI002117F303|nr:MULTISPECIES: STAS domain-containing protein [unclassified Aurantimonas]MCQ8784077.1 STAS domain-containing protein [Aurantimonas sp. CSK15Z-1]MCW4116796.1 STAS domain-containing protein [Aurantimonas sp. MSK8Z-1]
MSEAMSPSEGVAVELPAVLDIKAATPLAEQLSSLRGEAVALDASKVEQVGGLCLQVLLSAVATWKADGQPLELAAPSDAFEDGLKLLGLSVEQLLEKEVLQ